MLRPSSGQSFIQRDPAIIQYVQFWYDYPGSGRNMSTDAVRLTQTGRAAHNLGPFAKQTGLRWLLTNVEIAYLEFHEHQHIAVLFRQLSGFVC